MRSFSSTIRFIQEILDKHRTLCEKVVSLLRFSSMNYLSGGLGCKIRHPWLCLSKCHFTSVASRLYVSGLGYIVFYSILRKIESVFILTFMILVCLFALFHRYKIDKVSEWSCIHVNVLFKLYVCFYLFQKIILLKNMHFKW